MSNDQQAENKTEWRDGYKLGFCSELSLSDNNYPANYSLISANILCVIINCLHMLVLSRLKALNGSSYRPVLYHISLADICNSMAIAIRVSVKDYSVFTESPMAVTVLYDTIMDSAVFLRYNILAGACIERYIAVCKPMEYSSSLYIQRIHLSLGIFWLYTLAAVTIRNLASPSTFCISGLFGPTNVLSFTPAIMAASAVALPVLLSLVMLILVSIELVKMSRRSTTEQESQIYSAAKYLIIIIVMFYVFLITPIMQYVLSMFRVFFFGVGYIQYTLYSVYGILNTAIYGWMYRNYRETIKHIVRRTMFKLATISRSEVGPDNNRNVEEPESSPNVDRPADSS